MKTCCQVFICVVLLVAVSQTMAAPPTVADKEFHRLHALIQPCEGESPWREIDWLTNVTTAREKAVAENKPLVIFTAADGSPLGRT
jgi:hypothetical protein